MLSQAHKKGTATAKRLLRGACAGLSCETSIVETFQRVCDEVAGKGAVIDQAQTLRIVFAESPRGVEAAQQLIGVIRLLAFRLASRARLRGGLLIGIIMTLS